MAHKTKTVLRQPFGPNSTDFQLSYFVCWDRNHDLEDGIAESWAHFTDKEDAAAYFEQKAQDQSLYVWKGELGVAESDGQFDWFHTEWSKNLDAHLTEKPAKDKGYRFSNDAFEAFDPLEIEEEEAA